MNHLIVALAVVLRFMGFTPHPACEAAADRQEMQLLAEGDRLTRLAVCSVVTHAAEARGISAPLVVELMWSESRWTMWAQNPRSKCWGPLQVAPYFWCPDHSTKNCNPVLAGIQALKVYLKNSPDDLVDALCHFKSGNVCTPSAHWGAQDVVRKTKALERKLARLEPEPESEQFLALEYIWPWERNL